jgi:hypothetical protein
MSAMIEGASSEHSPARMLRQTASFYMAAIIAAEILLLVAGPVASLLAHSLLLIILAVRASRGDLLERQIFSVLMLHPLLRVVSLGLSVGNLPLLIQYVLVGLPLWVGIFLTARGNRLSPGDLGLTSPRLGWQLLIGLAGIPLGLLSRLLLHTEPTISGLTFSNLGTGLVIITVFGGAVEEIIFRGLLQPALSRTFGNYAILWVSILFASAYLGTLSVGYVVFMGLFGLAAGWAVSRTKSLWGVLIAHCALTCGALLIWPFVIH